VASPPFSRVAVAGPFLAGERDLFDDRLPPEGIDAPLAAPGVEWRVIDAGSWGEIRLASPCQGGREGAACIYAEAIAPAEFRADLEVASSAPYKVWMNGREVRGAREPAAARSGPDRLPVTLPGGTSRFLFKVVTRSANDCVLQARLIDPGRRLTLGAGKKS
jgi:hypothetical protein